LTFDGGGSSTQVTAHTHSNLSGDGGSLDLTDTRIETNLSPLSTVLIFGD